MGSLISAAGVIPPEGLILSWAHNMVTDMTSYIFDNAAERETEQRFSSLESLYDPLTIRHLVATGIDSGWRCWEIGGGSGSIGLWLSERIGRVARFSTASRWARDL